jgi:hypothetical protein
MLGKIALGVAVHSWDYDRVFEYQILIDKLILKGEYNNCFLVGTYPEPHPANPKIFDEFYLGKSRIGDTEYLVVKVRLFAYYGAPYYLVVIGYKPLSVLPARGSETKE